MLSVTGLTKKFGGFTAVKDVSFRAEAGQLVALLGPSGCGKSTLLRTIAGLEEVDAGQIAIGGRSGASMDKFMKQVLPGTFDFGFPVSSVCKDIGLAIEECEALGVPMWVGNSARQLWNFAKLHDGPNRDMTEIVRSISSWADGGKSGG